MAEDRTSARTGRTTTSTERDDEAQPVPEAAPQPPQAAGLDLDSKKRAAKTALAAAESTGDEEAATKARKDLDEVNEKLAELDRGTYREQSKEEAARQRRAAAAADAQGVQSTPPAGRTAGQRARTDAPTQEPKQKG